MGYVIKSIQTRIDNTVPVFGFHPHKKSVFCNAGVVYYDFDNSIWIFTLPLFKFLGNLFGIRYIELKKLAFSATFFNKRQCFLGSSFITPIIYNQTVVVIFGKL